SAGRVEHGCELASRSGLLVRRSLLGEHVRRILEQRSRAVLLATRAGEHPLGQVRSGLQVPRSGLRGDLAQRPDGASRAREVAELESRPEDELERVCPTRAARRDAPKHSLAALRRPAWIAAVEEQAAGTEERRLARARLREEALRLGDTTLSAAELGERHERPARPR